MHIILILVVMPCMNGILIGAQQHNKYINWILLHFFSVKKFWHVYHRNKVNKQNRRRLKTTGNVKTLNTAQHILTHWVLFCPQIILTFPLSHRLPTPLRCLSTRTWIWAAAFKDGQSRDSAPLTNKCPDVKSGETLLPMVASSTKSGGSTVLFTGASLLHTSGATQSTSQFMVGAGLKI